MPTISAPLGDPDRCGGSTARAGLRLKIHLQRIVVRVAWIPGKSDWRLWARVFFVAQFLGAYWGSIG